MRNLTNYKNKQTLRKPVWQDIIFRTCMEVRFITAMTRGLFFASPFKPLAPHERKIEPLAPRVAAARKAWKIQTWTGIRILTSALPVQCSRMQWSKFIHSDPHFKYKNSYIIIIYLYIYGLIIDQLPVGLMAQLVEHWIDNAEVRVRIPVQAWIFQAFLAAAQVALKCEYQNSFKIIVS